MRAARTGIVLVIPIIPLLALACADSTPMLGPENVATAPAVAGAAALSLDNERPFRTKATPSSRSSAAEGWTTTEARYPRMTIVSASNAPKSPSTVAQILFPAGMAGGDAPARATRSFSSPYRTVSVELWSALSSNWQGPATGSSDLFFLSIGGSRKLTFSASGEGSGKLTPMVALSGAPDSRAHLLPNVVAGATVNRGVWQRWRVVVTMNTPGQRDGVVGVELDGAPVLEYRDVELVAPGAVDAFDQLQWRPKWGGASDVVAADMTMRWDHVVIGGSVNRVDAGAPLPGDTTATRVVASVSLAPDSTSVAPGNTVRLQAVPRDSAGATVSGQMVSWTSSDTSIAKVSQAGLATGVKLGKTKVIAAVGDIVDTAVIVVAVSDTTAPAPGTRAGWYVASKGTSGGAGTATSPWDLATALAGGNGKIQPGDTVWVRGGDYPGTYASTLTGSPTQPIIVRAYPGERAAIVSQSLTSIPLRVRGEWAWYWGLEVYNANPQRYMTEGERPNCVYPSHPNNRFINLILHDCQTGMSFSNESRNSELYGSLIYNNGYYHAERTGGHGIYTKNDGSYRKLVRDNIVFNNMRVGMQIYTDAGSGNLRGFLVEGNTFFNNGVLTGTNTSATAMLIGGYEVADDIDVLDNMTYYSPSLGMRSVRLGYGNSLANGRLSFQRNYIVGNGDLLQISDWAQLTVSGNTLVGNNEVVSLDDATLSGYSWSGNMQHRDPSAAAWNFEGSGYSFADWRSRTGLGSGDQALSGRPTSTKVFVRENLYEAGRANVIVYNWAKQGTVSVDLSGVLKVGDRFEIRNVQAFWGAPVASGTYAGGSVTVPLGTVQPPTPIGTVPNQPVPTGMDFDAFVVLTR